MSRHQHSGMSAYLFFFMSIFVLGAFLPLFWLWFLPKYSVAFNTLSVRSTIKPFDSLMLIEFIAWPLVMIVFLKATMR